MKNLIIILSLLLCSYSYSQSSLLDTSNIHIIMWLSPDTGLYNSSGNPASYGDDVYEWHDISGNNFIFTNGENSNRPNYAHENGNSYLDFTPGDFLQSIDIKDSLNGLEEFSIFIVIKSDQTHTDKGFLDSENPDAKDDNICLRYDAKGANTGRVNCMKTGMVGNSAHHQVESQSNTQATDRQVLTLTWKRHERLFLYVNGVISDSSQHTFNNVISDVHKILLGKGPKDGSLTGNGGWDGKIGDIIFFNHKYPQDTVQSMSELLPVEMVSYKASVKNNKVAINWATSSENNNDYFEVQRSKDAVYFEHLENISGAGESNRLINYIYTDETPYDGISYYRIVQIDFDGNKHYYPVLPVNIESDNIVPEIIVFNSDNNLKIKYSHINQATNCEFYICNSAGQIIYNKRLTVNSNNIETLDLSFNSGTYFLISDINGVKDTKSFIIY